MSSQQLFAEMPEGVSTPELRVKLPEDSHRTYMQKLKDNVSFAGAQIIKTDGVRVEFQDGWGLVRASNTSPVLTVRFEADNQAAPGAHTGPIPRSIAGDGGHQPGVAFLRIIISSTGI